MGSNLHFKQITGVPAWRMDCDREGGPLGGNYRLAEANGGKGEGMCDQRAWSPGMRGEGRPQPCRQVGKERRAPGITPACGP